MILEKAVISKDAFIMKVELLLLGSYSHYIFHSKKSQWVHRFNNSFFFLINEKRNIIEFRVLVLISIGVMLSRQTV